MHFARTANMSCNLNRSKTGEVQPMIFRLSFKLWCISISFANPQRFRRNLIKPLRNKHIASLGTSAIIGFRFARVVAVIRRSRVPIFVASHICNHQPERAKTNRCSSVTHQIGDLMVSFTVHSLVPWRMITVLGMIDECSVRAILSIDWRLLRTL